ncbi:MAG: efflux RND transporter permease subunit [Patescibacteria group bacterium]|nr:efflux RND transporter permease subunit [Patescibacteria group bacterium]
MEMKEKIEKKSIWESFVRHYRLTLIFILGIVLLGVLAIMQMPKESSPEIDFPVAVVTTSFLGASASDVEELVTNPLEDKIKSLTGIDNLTSSSQQGISMITVSFDVNADSLKSMTDLRSKIDSAIPNLPGDVSAPNVQQISFSDMPILQISVSGPFQAMDLKNFAETLKDEIETVTGVSQVNLIGAPDREVRVLINKSSLDQFNLSIGQVSNAITQANINLPVGSIESADAIYSVRFAGQIFSAEDVINVPIATIDDTVITVGDIARVLDGPVDTGSIARLSVNGGEPTPSVSLQIFKVSGGNILEVADAIDSKISELKSNTLPNNLQIEIVASDAERIRIDLNNLLVNGLETILIIIILLLIFLGWREAILASLAVPLTFLMSFIVLGQLGYTINFLTLFSLILSLGILVDGAIVMVEGMHNHLSSGKSPKEAAVATIREFQTPLIAGTMTTIFVFLPMLMTSGIIGKFIVSIPVTVTVVLVSSIIVALGMVTTLGSKFLHTGSAVSKNNNKKNGSGKIISKVYAAYSRSLSNLLTSAKKRNTVFLIMIVLFFLSMLLPITGILKVSMFPQTDTDTFSIDIEKSVGTPLETTDAFSKQIEDMLVEDKRIKSFITKIGSTSGAGSVSAGNSNSHLGSFTVNLLPDRQETSMEISEEYEEKFNNITGGKVTIVQQTNGPEQGAPVNIKISGVNIDKLEAIANDAKKLLENIPGSNNVEVSTKDNSGEFVLSIDRSKAKFYGVSTAEVASLLRNAVTGSTVTVLKKDGEDIDVVVKYDMDVQSEGFSRLDVVDIGEISSLSITTAKGRIPLVSFLSTDLDSNRAVINHEDGDQLVSVTSFVKDGYQAQQIVLAFQKQVASLNLPAGYSLTYGGETESINESFADMFKAMILGIFMIAGLLVWQFRSYRQPLFVLSSIPLSLIGVFPGLVLVGQSISFPSFIGIVALAGIVVNNAIILIDRINENRINNGMSIDESIADAASSRLQPILLTTITTVAGILPLALTNPSWGPLGYSIVFGLLFSTVLTLFMVPLLYQRFGEKVLDAND